MNKKTKTKITIITINLNDAKGLKATIKSVRDNCQDELEYIIIDGNSNDESISIIKENQDIIKHWLSEQDKGIYDAMNKGVSLATSEWILFLNSGDELACSCEELLRICNPNKIIVYGTTIIFDGKNELFKWGKPLRRQIDIILRPPFFHQSILYQRRYIGRYSLEYPLIADRVMTYNVVKNSAIEKIEFVKRPISRFLDGGISTIHSKEILQEERRFLLSIQQFGIRAKIISVYKFFKTSVGNLTQKLPFFKTLRKLKWVTGA